jgi:hypothetical protein
MNLKDVDVSTLSPEQHAAYDRAVDAECEAAAEKYELEMLRALAEEAAVLLDLIDDYGEREFESALTPELAAQAKKLDERVREWNRFTGEDEDD